MRSQIGSRASFPVLSVTRILDLFFPPSCVSCRKKGFWWCVECRSAVKALQSDPCPRCLGDHRKKKASMCTGRLPFAGVVATGFYHSRELRTFITSLKYEGLTDGAENLKEYLVEWNSKRSEEFPWVKERNLAIVPMPLASARQRERGFNQSEWIAKRLHETLVPRARILTAVARIASSTPQATIEDHELRRINVRGGFVSTASVPEAVILVDDVLTTGATCREVARVLLETGAKRVYVFTLALGK